MKSEELLTGLSEVGEDLLAETENGIRVSSKKPRAWIGLAAALALVVGLGGLIFWQVRKHRQSTPADPADTVTMSGPEAEALEQFYVDRNWRGESAWTFDDLERSLRVNRWTLETGADRLPVYEVATNHPELEGWTWEGGMDQSLRRILADAAARLGLPEPEDVRIQEEGSEIAWVEADTEMGVLTVYLNGTVRILFDEDHRLTSGAKIDYAEEPPAEERAADYRDTVMEACGEQVVELLGLPECHPAVCDRYSSLSSAYTAYILYPVREDPAEQLKSRYFEQVRMLTADGREALGLEWERLPEAGGTCAVPADWRLVGNYPIISAEEAKQAALQGAYYIDTRTNAVPPSVAEENLAWGELVYLPDAEDVGILLPFYRFWVPCREGEVTPLMSAMAIYVPAVDPAYLIDFGPEDMPIHVEDPTAQATTEAPDPGDIEETDDPWAEETDEVDKPDPAVQDPTAGNFTAVNAADRRYFTDGLTELWLENGAVLKKDLGSGETLTLFSLEPSDEIRTELVGVTSRRLYFGWINTADDWWGGLTVYSVDYQNQDRQDLGGGRQDVSCKDGWILLEDHRTDVGMVILRVIDRDDRIVVDQNASWGGAVVDGCVWYIYAPSLPDTEEELEPMPPEEVDALLRNTEYQVWLLERKGETLHNTLVHTIQLPSYYGAYLEIDPEARVIKGNGIQPLDLDTLKSKIAEPGAVDPRNPEPDNTLPGLSLAHCLSNNGEESKLFRDIGAEIALSPCFDFTMEQPNKLPVYRNLAYVDESGIPVYLTREEMQLRADALVQRWKLQVQREEWIDGALREDDPEGTEPNPSALILETDKATVTVYGNGEQTVFFREPLDQDTELACEWVYDPAGPLSYERAMAYAQGWAEYCEGTEDLAVHCEPIYGYADMEAKTYACIYYLTEPVDLEVQDELTQRLLESTFHEQLYMDEHGNLTGYRTHLTPARAVHSDYDYAAELIGTYPILTKAEADQALMDGFFFTNASIPLFRNGMNLGEALLAHTVAAELVYRTGNDEYFQPYYRYWVVGDVPETAGGLTQCAAVYVPAIPKEYLTDWPEYLMPGWFGDDELAALQALFEGEDSWYGRILRCGAFSSPDLVPLGNLLSAGLPGVDNTLSDEERAELEAAASPELLDTGVEPVKLPKQALNDLLKRGLGLTLDQIQYNDLRDWVYLESRDCYYLFGEDPGGLVIEVESYLTLSDSELQLRYWRGEDGGNKPVMYVANLQKTADGYIVLNNEPAVWNN